MKKILAFVLAVTMCLALVSCSKPANSGNTGTAGSGAASSGATQTPPTTPARKTPATLATGGPTGTYYAVGSSLATVLNPVLTLTEINVASTGASKANVQMVTSGEAMMSILQSDVLAYAHGGTDVFANDGADTNTLWVAGLYNETVQITARGGITDVAELKGKTVCVGDAGSGTEFNARQVLEAYNLSFEDINVVNAGFGDAAEMLKQGQIDAAFTVAGAPTPAITELAASGMDFSMVSLTPEAVEYLTTTYPFLVQEDLPSGTYQGVDTNTTCVAVKAVLAASKDMSTEAVYELTKAMFDNLDTLQGSHDKFKVVSAEAASNNGDVPMHPGAEQYYKEAGVIK